MPHDFSQAPSYRLLDDFGNASDPFRAVRDGGQVVAEDGRVFEGEAFGELAYRCGAGGEMVASVDQPLFQQQLAVNEAVGRGVAGLGPHLADLRALRLAAGPAAEAEGDGLKLDLHMHDMVESGMRDEAGSEEEERVRARARAQAAERIENARAREGVYDEEEDEYRMPEHVETDVMLARLESDLGIDAGEWYNVSEYATFALEQVRSAARMMLAPILGKDVALEDLRRLEFPKSDVERYGALQEWAMSSGGAKEYPPFRHPQMPGYVTSPVTYGEVDGVAVLIFSDFRASYAYAWQTNPELVAAPEEPAAPRP